LSGLTVYRGPYYGSRCALASQGGVLPLVAIEMQVVSFGVGIGSAVANTAAALNDDLGMGTRRSSKH